MPTYEYVPVPTDRLAEVYALLARPAAASDLESDTDVDPRPPTGPVPEFWTAEANIKKHLKPRSETIRGFCKYLADHPGRLVSSDEAAAALNLPRGWMSLAGANGALAVYLKNRGLDLPWEWEYAGDNRVRFKMDPAIAEAIKTFL